MSSSNDVNMTSLDQGGEYAALITDLSKVFDCLPHDLIHTVPLTISYHLFRFLIGQYSVVEIRYFIKKRNNNDKNTKQKNKTNPRKSM